MTTAVCELDSVYERFVAGFTIRMIRFVWKLPVRRQTEWINYLIGFALYFLDALFCEVLGARTSLRFLFVRKD